MFSSNLNKTPFGSSTANTAFGLGASTSTTASPWGAQNNSQIFGGKPATPGFGQQPSTSFGQPSTSSNSMFPFFPQSNTSGFGSNPTNQSTFGSNIFGQQQQQQPASNTLFGSNTFGQQKTTGFGGFGTQNQQQPNLFGQTSQAQSSIFQPTGSSNLFGSSNAFSSTTLGTGTTIKFNPVTGTDTMQKSGITTSINTKHHCITCMKEYEGKSLEELRLEDYQANRKGPQSTQFGATPFGGGNTTSMFGQTAENKPAFGQTTNSFGQIGGSTFGQQPFGMTTPQSTSNNIFGKPAFGTTGTTTTGFGNFNTTSNVTGAFGSNQNKPFGTATPTPLFGSTQPQQQQTTPFGSNLFGQNNQNTTGSFFNKPPQTTGFGSTLGGGFGFNQSSTTPTSNLFQQSKPAFGLGQTTTTSTFGQTPAFGQVNQQNTFGNSSFGKLTFGQTQNAFQQPGQTSLFSNNQQKPASILGTGGGLFGTNTFGNNATSTFGFSQPNVQQPAQGFSLDASQDKNLSLLSNNQFGHSPYLAGLLPVDKSSSPTLYTTNPAEIKKMLETNKKIDDKNSNRKLNLKLGPPKSQRDNLFDEANDEDVNKLYRGSCKRLILKKKADDSKSSVFETDSIFTDLVTQKSDMSLASKASESSPVENRSNQSEIDNYKTMELKYLSRKSLPKQNLEKFFTQNDSSLINDNLLNSVDASTDAQKEFNETNTSLNNSNIDKGNNNFVASDVSPTIEVIERESTTSLHPQKSGITLNRAEYYTLPAIHELDDMVGEDGRCMVKGFTVGRRGYGNVYFLDEIDVRNLNLDEIVHFRYKEINMYPDENKKPPVGEGLNRRAQVTLDKVYPRVKETKEIITDVDQVLAAKFPEQLVEISSKHGLKFIDYRPETGSWVFMVDHFSKYAFTESDEEDCELSVAAKNLKNANKNIDNNPVKRNDKIPFSEMSKAELLADNMDGVMESESMFYESEDNYPRSNDILHKSIAVDLEGNEDFIGPVYEPNDQDIYYHNSHIQMMKATFFSESECASTISSTDYIGGVFKSDVLEFPTRPKIIQYRQPKRPKVSKIYVNTASRPDDSLLLESCRCYSDFGLFRGKSFKVGWSNGFKLFTVNFPNVSDVDNTLLLALNTVKTTSFTASFKSAISSCMRAAQEHSDFSLDGPEEIPTFNIIQDRTYLMACHKIFKEISDQMRTKSESVYYKVWSLCNALWGPGRRSSPFVKDRLSSWLKSVTNSECTSKNFLSDSIEDKLEMIFIQLSCFNVKEAADLAMEADMPALSLLISQVNLSQKLKAQMRNQLNQWFRNMYSDHIGVEMIKIYTLLSGTPCFKDINVCDGLDWLRTFGVHLWYFTSGGSPLKEAIEKYKNGYSQLKYAIEPRASYESEEESPTFDILYHILQLYQNRAYKLTKVLNPDTHTDLKTDYQLSWLLLLFFKSISVGLIDDNEETHIHTSFSSQLENEGFWDIAILPLLYLKNNFLKKQLIMGILNRNLSCENNEINAEIENNLIEVFHVPFNWIEMAKKRKNENEFSDK